MNSNYPYNNEDVVVVQSGVFAALMQKVYLWMTLALAVTGLTAYWVGSNLDFVYALAGNSLMFWGIIAAELGLVYFLSARITRLSFSTAGLLFIIYSILNGITMSFIFVVYTASSIASVFFITAGMFGAMSLIGFFTKKDLTSMGKFLMMALIGLIIASVVNIFMKSETLYWIASYAGVIIFVGLTAYDTQKIKNLLLLNSHEVNEESQKLALLGSLTLYLDFINLFLYLLRIFGDRK